MLVIAGRNVNGSSTPQLHPVTTLLQSFDGADTCHSRPNLRTRPVAFAHRLTGPSGARNGHVNDHGYVRHSDRNDDHAFVPLDCILDDDGRRLNGHDLLRLNLNTSLVEELHSAQFRTICWDMHIPDHTRDDVQDVASNSSQLLQNHQCC
jgi:hypothetical protein